MFISIIIYSNMMMIRLITPKDYSLNRDILNNMYRLRHKVFFEKLKWHVTSHNKMERDSFDENNTYYLVYQDEQGQVRGCQRYIRMDHHCMFDGPFNFLSQYLVDYKNGNYWEASRLAVDYDFDASYSKQEAACVCKTIFAASAEFGQSQEAKGFLTLSYPSIARIIAQQFSLQPVVHGTINYEAIVVSLYSPYAKKTTSIKIALKQSSNNRSSSRGVRHA